MTRVFTIWPADREGIPAKSSEAWRQDRHWLVLDITGCDPCVVEGPVSRGTALRRELELRAIARSAKPPSLDAALNSGKGIYKP